MEKTVERKTLDKIYTDVEVGLYLIRGENIVILGEMVRPAVRALLVCLCNHCIMYELPYF